MYKSLAGLMIMACGTFADPGVILEATNDTVVKVKYLGSSTGDAPILSVTGGKKYGAVVEGTWRGVTGRVPGYSLPYPAVAAGLAGAGPIGVTGYGTGSSSNVIGGHFMTSSSHSSGNNYAVEARASGVYNVYGVFAHASGGSNNNWAGMFAGNTFATGTYQGSDRMFKKNIESYSNGIEKVMALRPKSYDTRADEFKGDLELPKGRQVGLIAQDVEQIMPELVTDVQIPPSLTSEEIAAGIQKDGLKFKGVNYTGLIPVLVAAIQEQQVLIEALKAEMSALKK